MLESIKKLFDTWNFSGINYCHWKSSNHLEATIKGETDLDILVDSQNGEQAEQLAIAVGYERLQTVNLRSYSGVHDFVCLDKSGKWAHIHLHYQTVLGDRWVKAFWLPYEADILSRKVWSDKYNSFVISPNDELIIFCARMSLKYKRPFKQKNIFDELIYLKKHCSKDSLLQNNIIKEHVALSKLVNEIISKENINISRINKIASAVSRELRFFNRFNRNRFRSLSIYRKIYRYYIEFKRRYLKNFESGRRTIPRGGKLVVFVGIDGSGKTSAVERMERLFSIQMNVKRVFLGNGKSGAAWYRKIVLSILGSKAKMKKHKKARSSSSHSKKQRIPWYYGIWLLLCIKDRKSQLKEAISAKANSSLVFSDRWPQTDIFGTLDGPRISSSAEHNFFIRYIIRKEKELFSLSKLFKPDLVLKFQVSPSKSVERKPFDLTEDMARIQGEQLNEVSWEGSEIIDVDADASITEVDKFIRDAIWETVRNYSN